MNRHSEIQEYKMMWCSIFISAIFTFCIGLVISVFVVDKLDVNYILQHFYRPITDFTAETQEKMQYILCTVSYPVIFFISFSIVKKFVSFSNSNVYTKGYLSVILTGILLVISLAGTGGGVHTVDLQGFRP